MRQYLSREGNPSEPRKMFILAGDEKWHARVLSEFLEGFESRSLWVSDKEIANSQLSASLKNKIPSTHVSHAHHWLGGEKQIVVFDAIESFNVDAFAAISGIVVGGGIFIVLMPVKEKWPDIYSSPFGTRLLEHINKEPEIVVVSEENKITNFNFTVKNKILVRDCTPPFLTSDQQSAVEQIAEDVLGEAKHAFVIVSDRGRGKSAALGLLAAQLIKAGIKNIAITAPRLRATDVIFKHAEQHLSSAVVSRGSIKYKDRSLQFYSPDELLSSDNTIELLLIDEAAAIPVPILTSLLIKYPQCIFATTVHGYEGTGRGFSLRFNKVLEELKPDWRRIQLQTPIRWPEDDMLEKWVFSLLCLDSEIVDSKTLKEIDLETVKHKLVTREQLQKDDVLLNEVFALLVLAHYRTRPGDLKNLLDDEALSLYVTMHQQHVIAVALVVREGQFTSSLSTSVYRGERRPQGHLLAQALTYHCGIEQAATLDYARVMRIAVHPELQQQGIGTQLLDFIVSYERSRGCDAIGTSFGMNKVLLDFWKQAGFDLIRIGFTREQTSGEHAAIMLIPLSHNGIDVNLEAARRFNNQITYWLDDVLNDLPGDIKQDFPATIDENLVLTKDDKKDIDSFINTSRNYELCIAAIKKFVMLSQAIISLSDVPEKYSQIIHAKVVENKSWKIIAEEQALRGKDEAREIFKAGILKLIGLADNRLDIRVK